MQQPCRSFELQSESEASRTVAMKGCRGWPARDVEELLVCRAVDRSADSPDEAIELLSHGTASTSAWTQPLKPIQPLSQMVRGKWVWMARGGCMANLVIPTG